MESGVPIAHCKRLLATIWFVGGGIIFFLVLTQSLFDRYGDQVSRVWGWLLPTVLPTLSLIIGQLVFDAVQGGLADRTMDRFLFRLTAWLSCGYLLAVFLVIVLTPFSTLGPIQLMTEANVWLGPVQGLVAAAMGAFFVKAAREGQDGLERRSEIELAVAAARNYEERRESETLTRRPGEAP
jgi:hypothetical protein